jgi:hypothetical protein
MPVCVLALCEALMDSPTTRFRTGSRQQSALAQGLRSILMTSVVGTVIVPQFQQNPYKRSTRMDQRTFPSLKVLQHYWSHALLNALRSQWIMLETGLQTASTMLRSAASAAARDAPVPSTSNAGPQDLIGIAVQRMKNGFAPPKEIYQAPYRNLIDWSSFPEWARPSDPEMYEGTSHEG